MPKHSSLASSTSRSTGGRRLNQRLSVGAAVLAALGLAACSDQPITTDDGQNYIIQGKWIAAWVADAISIRYHEVEVYGEELLVDYHLSLLQTSPLSYIDRPIISDFDHRYRDIQSYVARTQSDNQKLLRNLSAQEIKKQLQKSSKRTGKYSEAEITLAAFDLIAQEVLNERFLPQTELVKYLTETYGLKFGGQVRLIKVLDQYVKGCKVYKNFAITDASSLRSQLIDEHRKAFEKVKFSDQQINQFIERANDNNQKLCTELTEVAKLLNDPALFNKDAYLEAINSAEAKTAAGFLGLFFGVSSF